MKKKILVTGGAGYIGSHVVEVLGEHGYDVLVFDNLSTGRRDLVLYGTFVKGDLADLDLVNRTVKEYKPDAAIHFAASIEVAESVRDPMKYYRNNTVNTINLVDLLSEHGVGKLVFSSTAAVYGVPGRQKPVDEDAVLFPINPYGWTKLMAERVLRDLSSAGDSFRYVALRYFNVAGADPDGRIGQRYPVPTHIITRCLKAAKGELSGLGIYGTDYPTPDGTCIRDYIHVTDLANAHVAALDHLLGGGKSDVFNCGYGHGASVREVVRAAKEVTGVDFPVTEEARRPGDPPFLVADPSKIVRELSWKPRYDDLRYIVETAWNWEKTLKP